MWKTTYTPPPPKPGGRGKKEPPGSVAAVYADGDYSFTFEARVEADDDSELAAFRAKALAALAKDREERAAAKAVEAKLDALLNAPAA